MEKLRALLKILVAAVMLHFGVFHSFNLTAAESISFNRDIRPILSDDCFHCHGFDAKTRKGKFRLDVREDAVTKGAIVPGKPRESELIKRILSTNLDEVMPPPDTHKTLSPSQKDLLRRWIANGAKYEKHWAYVPPVKAAIPANKNPIDVLVRTRLHELGLTPVPPADRRTLARRLYFDLIGLPPTPEEVEAFEKDKSPEAVAQLVEKLLSSPQYGERMAIGWLDVVRFADTIGYHSDNPRNIWPYRDYVIKAFNDNKPFDQFTREQLAGDLLPGSTREQKVASAYNRLLLTTEEGGAQPKDYEARMLTDRVRDVSAVWLGQTVGCAQCHDHKFDPIKQRDFYALGAFFADIEEPILGHREPGMLLPDEQQAVKLKELEDKLAVVKKDFDAPHPEWQEAFAKWQKEQTEIVLQERRWSIPAPESVSSTGGSELTIQKTNDILVTGAKPETDAYLISFTNVIKGMVALRIEALPHDTLPGKGAARADDGGFVLTKVKARIISSSGSTNEIAFNTARADFEQVADSGTNLDSAWNAVSVISEKSNGKTNGWAILPQTNQQHQIVLGLAAPAIVNAGDKLVVELEQNQLGQALGHFRLGYSVHPEALQGPLRYPLPKEFADILVTVAEKRDEKQNTKIYDKFKDVAPEAEQVRKPYLEALKLRDDFTATITRCLVSSTNAQPRTVRVLPRGNFLVETGDVVQPALPPYLLNADVKLPDRRLNRLDLANWLVSRENPLTARVIMNRLWKQFFGLGLSKVVDDLGAQGELPPNQTLLDWLACEFMDSGWDVKHMIRIIVNSDTYQQSSVSSKKLRARDPLNRELAVQSRWRIEAELVRDNALSVSGLLVEKTGGPSVKPYQPEGYWENLNFPVRTYDASAGSDQYRRGLYMWWQRSYLHPSLLAFDAPTREECAAERNRSNIPQQALVLLNDPTYVEASRALAVRTMKEGGLDVASRLRWAWRQVLSRSPRADELKSIESLLKKQIAEYRADPAAAKELLKIGQAPAPNDLDATELAAWTNIARVLLNLHETITRS